MLLQKIFDDLVAIANSPTTQQTLQSFHNVAYPLVYVPKKRHEEDDNDRLPQFFDVTALQVKALENPASVKNPNEFQQIILFLTALYQNETLNMGIRILAAKSAFAKYASTLPDSGLPLNNAHVAGCIRWSNHIIDANINGGHWERTLLQIKIVHVEWLSAFYQRRNAYTLAGECYDRLGKSFLNLSDSKYKDVVKMQKNAIALYRKGISEQQTLNSSEVKALMSALKLHIAFCAHVPDTKKAYMLYVSVAERIEQIRAERRGENLQAVEGSSTREENIDDEAIHTVQGTSVWDCSEAEDAKKSVYTTSGILGKLLATTPKASNQKPDYQQAAQWLLVAKGSRHAFDGADLAGIYGTPEIQTAIAQLKGKVRVNINTTSRAAGVFFDSNNPATDSSASEIAQAASTAAATTDYIPSCSLH